jgi:PAS domain S-box-containing protein
VRISQFISDQAVDFLDEVLLVMGLDGSILDANAAALDCYRYSRAEMLALSIYDLKARGDRDPLDDQVREAAERGVRLERVHRRSDGTLFPVEVLSVPVTVDGETSMFAVITDLTARKEAEEALRESEEKYRSVVEHAREGIVIVQDGRFKFFNQGFADMSGYTLDELAETAFVEIVPLEQRASLLDRVARRLAGEDLTACYEMDFLHKDGRRFTCELNGSLITYHGAPADLAVGRDVTERRRAEETLHRSESLLRGIADASTSLIFVMDLDGRFIFANRELEDLFGVSAGGLVGKTREGFVPAEVRDQHRANDLQVIESRRPLTREEANEEADGVHTYLSVKTPLMDTDGRVFAVAGTSTDITGRRKAEEALRHEEEVYRATFDQAAVGIAHVAPDGRWLRVNKCLCDILGYTREELARITFADITHPDDVDQNVEHLRKLLAGEEATYETEKRYLRKDGSVVWVNLSVAAIRDEDGSLDYQVTVMEDITEGKRAEQALRDSERFNASILDTTPNLIYIYDLVENRNVYANREVTEFLGYTPEQIQAFGSTLFEHILHPDDAEHVAGHHARCAEAGDAEVLEVEYRMKHSNGQWRWLQSWDVAYVRDDQGRVARILGFTEDITERKRAENQLQELAKSLESRIEERTHELNDTVEELRESNDAKNRFLRSMSHELRTPLNSIIGFSGILSDGLAGEVNEEQSRQLAMIRSSGQHLLALINDILDLSRIEAGQVDVDIEPIDVAAFLAEVISDCGPPAEGKGLALRMEVAEPAPRLSSDIRRVRQILLNLLSNAIKFTETGGIVVRARRASGRLVSLSVSDTGLGISAEDQEHIFGEFEQAAGQAPNIEGTGLGLAISRGLAGSLGGTVEVESEVGIGSTFTLTLPEALQSAKE